MPMLEQNGILAVPGMGTVFLIVALICFLVIKKIVNARRVSNGTDTLQANGSVPSQTGGANKAAAVTAAIVAAVTEYRKYNP